MDLSKSIDYGLIKVYRLRTYQSVEITDLSKSIDYGLIKVYRLRTYQSL